MALSAGIYGIFASAANSIRTAELAVGGGGHFGRLGHNHLDILRHTFFPDHDT